MNVKIFFHQRYIKGKRYCFFSNNLLLDIKQNKLGLTTSQKLQITPNRPAIRNQHSNSHLCILPLKQWKMPLKHSPSLFLCFCQDFCSVLVRTPLIQLCWGVTGKIITIRQVPTPCQILNKLSLALNEQIIVPLPPQTVRLSLPDYRFFYSFRKKQNKMSSLKQTIKLGSHMKQNMNSPNYCCASVMAN